MVFGALTIVGGILIFFLPETHRRPLPVTIEEVENMTKTIVSKPAKHHPEKHQLSHNSEQYLENSQL